MKEKIIHQLFFKIEKDMSDYPLFIENQKKWIKWCNTNGYEYKFHTESNIDKYLINDELRLFYISLRFDWLRIDFIRYLIINQDGGLYIDLDIHLSPQGESFFLDYLNSRDVVVCLDFKNNYCNCLFGFPQGSIQSLIDFAIKQTNEKSSMPIYNIRKGRYLTNSTGTGMFAKWCRLMKIDKCNYLTELLINHWSGSWTETLVNKNLARAWEKKKRSGLIL